MGFTPLKPYIPPGSLATKSTFGSPLPWNKPPLAYHYIQQSSGYIPGTVRSRPKRQNPQQTLRGRFSLKQTCLKVVSFGLKRHCPQNASCETNIAGENRLSQKDLHHLPTINFHNTWPKTCFVYGWWWIHMWILRLQEAQWVFQCQQVCFERPASSVLKSKLPASTKQTSVFKDHAFNLRKPCNTNHDPKFRNTTLRLLKTNSSSKIS